MEDGVITIASLKTSVLKVRTVLDSIFVLLVRARLITGHLLGKRHLCFVPGGDCKGMKEMEEVVEVVEGVMLM